jgi:hypothetical protein
MERAIEALRRDPRPKGKLVTRSRAREMLSFSDRVGFYRYRIVYEVIYAERTVLILGHRPSPGSGRVAQAPALNKRSATCFPRVAP